MSSLPVAHLSLWDWYFEPTVVLGLVLTTVFYVYLWRRGFLRQTDDVSPWFRADHRRLAFIIGMAVAVVALLSPIDRGGDLYLFSLHMLQHIMLMMVVPPLLILGLVGGAPLAGVPKPLVIAGKVLTNPWVALLTFNAVMLLWHAPDLYDATLTTEWIHVVEHLSFLLTGLLFWWPIVDPWRSSGTRPVSTLAKITMLTASCIPPTILGLIFTISNSIFYVYYALAPRLWGLSLLVDQQIGGVLMLGLGNLIYFVAVAKIFWRLFGDPEKDEIAARSPALLAAEKGEVTTA